MSRSIFSKTREDIEATTATHRVFVDQLKEMKDLTPESSDRSDEIKKATQGLQEKSGFGPPAPVPGGSTPFGTAPNVPGGGGGFEGDVVAGSYTFETAEDLVRNRRSTGTSGGHNESRYKGPSLDSAAVKSLEELGLPTDELWIKAWIFAFKDTGGLNHPTAEAVKLWHVTLSENPDRGYYTLQDPVTGVMTPFTAPRLGRVSGSSGGNNSSGSSSYSSPSSSIPNPNSSSGGSSGKYANQISDSVERSGQSIVTALARIEKRLESDKSSDFRRLGI